MKKSFSVVTVSIFLFSLYNIGIVYALDKATIRNVDNEFQKAIEKNHHFRLESQIEQFSLYLSNINDALTTLTKKNEQEITLYLQKRVKDHIATLKKKLSTQQLGGSQTLTNVDLAKVRKNFIAMINEERKKYGYLPLQLDKYLNNSAQQRTDVILEKKQLTHQRSAKDKSYDTEAIKQRFAGQMIEFETWDNKTFNETLSEGRYRCNKSDCTKELSASIKTTYERFAKQKDQKHRDQYNAMTNKAYQIVGMGLSFDKKAGKYYMTLHYGTNLKAQRAKDNTIVVNREKPKTALTTPTTTTATSSPAIPVVTSPTHAVASTVFAQSTLPQNINIDKVRQVWLDWTNAERSKLGLSSYTLDAYLNISATKRSEEAKIKGKINHERNPGDGYYNYSVLEQRFKNQGLVFANWNKVTFTENVGYGSYSCSQADCTSEIIKAISSTFNFFMSEKDKTYQAHYKSIINSQFKIIGVGLAIDQSKKKYYITIHYGTELK